MQEFKVGEVVRCTAGKEKGLLFAVTSVGKDRLLISDGRIRRLNQPKTKSVKHVRSAGLVLDETCFRSNLDLRRALRRAEEHGRS